MIDAPVPAAKPFFLTETAISSLASRHPKVKIKGVSYPVDRIGLIDSGRRFEINAPPDPEQVRAASRWLCECAIHGMTKTPIIDSYRLKHAAEKWAREYIGNGAFILAADRCGFALSVSRPIQPCNAMVGIGWGWFRRQPESQARTGLSREYHPYDAGGHPLKNRPSN